MEKNCRAHTKVEAVGNTVVYHRCLENMVLDKFFCERHLAALMIWIEDIEQNGYKPNIN